MASLFDPVQQTYSASQMQLPAASTDPKIIAAEQAARQAGLNRGMGPGYAQGVDPSVYQTLFGTNAQGNVVRNSDGYVSQTNMGSIQNPNAQQYFKQNPQEAFFLGSVGQGQFKNAGVRGTNLKLGELSPDQWYRGYTSNFGQGWDQDTSNTYRWDGQDSQPVGQNGMGALGSDMGGYGSSGSYGSTGGSGGLNPYLSSAQQAITQQVTDNLQRNILPGINSSAQGVGGFGGSRQGVVQANALRDANQQITNGLAGLSFNAYEGDQGRQLQRYGIDANYSLGAMNANNNFYTAQRGQDLTALGLGASLTNQANQGYLNQGQGMYGIGNIYQQAPWGTMGNYNGVMTPYTGYGSTSTSGTGGGASGALGGAMGGAQLWSMFGNSNPYQMVNSGGVSNLPSMYLNW